MNWRQTQEESARRSAESSRREIIAYGFHYAIQSKGIPVRCQQS